MSSIFWGGIIGISFNVLVGPHNFHDFIEKNYKNSEDQLDYQVFLYWLIIMAIFDNTCCGLNVPDFLDQTDR